MPVAPPARYPAPVAADAPMLHRLWARDARLWRDKPDNPAETALDWLDAPRRNLAALPALEAWAADIHERLHPQRLLLIGQGGATLGAQVLAALAPHKALEFQALESLNAAALEAIAATSLEHTLIVIASKSGDTLETADLARYCESLPGARTDHLIAITDPGTALHEDARKRGYPVRLNPPGIGGRYSVLSEFGLAVAALLKLPLYDLLQHAQTMADACQLPPPDNPGVRMGEYLYECWRTPSKHLYLDIELPLERLGLWLEQLIAESCGKQGDGILPVRCNIAPNFVTKVHFRWRKPSYNPPWQRGVLDWAALGGEFFRWQFAVVWACARRGRNPFDQPDVAAAKQNTRALLKRKQPLDLPALSCPPLSLTSTLTPAPDDTPARLLARFLANIPRDDYLAVLVHLPDQTDVRRALELLEIDLNHRTEWPVTLSFAPQYLHATGQMHKGGPATGHFLQILPADEPPISIPGRDYTFAHLLTAQADADWLRLAELGRPVLRTTLHGNPVEALPALTALVSARRK